MGSYLYQVHLYHRRYIEDRQSEPFHWTSVGSEGGALKAQTNFLRRTGEAVPLGEITEQHFDATFGLNTRGTLFAVQKALPLFNDGGSIFMTGSVASVKGFPGYGVYSASKAALRSFARTWLNELKGRNIRVNVLSPGPIATPMQDQVLTEEAKRMFESLIPRGKMGRPEEIATVALFLASDDSSFVNGVELSVDGGFSAI